MVSFIRIEMKLLIFIEIEYSMGFFYNLLLHRNLRSSKYKAIDHTF